MGGLFSGEKRSEQVTQAVAIETKQRRNRGSWVSDFILSTVTLRGVSSPKDSV